MNVSWVLLLLASSKIASEISSLVVLFSSLVLTILSLEGVLLVSWLVVIPHLLANVVLEGFVGHKLVPLLQKSVLHWVVVASLDIRSLPVLLVFIEWLRVDV